MILTYDNYCMRMSEIRNLFTETMKMIFLNDWSYEEAVLHSLFVEESNASYSIYYDEEKLEESEFFKGKHKSNSQFIAEYVQERTNRKNVILEKLILNAEDGYMRRVYWVFVCKCLDDDYGTLALRNCFSQLAERFKKIMVKSCSETGSDGVIAVWAEEIIQKTEMKIKVYLEGFFAPFKADMVYALSGEYYEKSECKSNIVLLPNGVTDTFQAEDFLYRLKDTVFDFRNNRFLRKLLQMTQNDLYLVLESDKDNKKFHVRGICNDEALHRKMRTEEGVAIPYLVIKIVKHMMWEIFLDDSYIVTARNGHYRINRPLQKEYLADKLENYFGEQGDKYETLIENIIRSTGQNHGTMLVIMSPKDTKEEAMRLSNQNYGFAENPPRILTKEINQLNAIDGCILIDTNGKVHGIGMILDGLSVESGNPARGARYNSAMKYKYPAPESRPNATRRAMVVVVSEDGSVDIITF